MGGSGVDGATIGINGFGRIGRAFLRAALQNPLARVTAINDPYVTPEYAAYLLTHDTVDHSRMSIEAQDSAIVVNGNFIEVSQKSDPASIPWKVTYVVDCSGVFTTVERASAHLASGASRVVIGAPSPDAPLIIAGVNDEKFKAATQVISGGSPTGVALTSVVKTLNDLIPIESCSFTAIHAATAQQKPVDATSLKDWRAGRSANNIVPFTTGAHKTLAKACPQLAPNVIGSSVRVPTQQGCALDLTVRFQRATSRDDVLRAVHAIAGNAKLGGILEVTEEDLVSSDVMRCGGAAVLDAKSLQLMGEKTAKMLFWYDNENGYARRLVELVARTSQQW